MSKSPRAGLVKKTFKKSNIWTELGRMDRIRFSREGRASRQQGQWMQSVQRKGACGVQVGGKGRRVLGTFQLPMWRQCWFGYIALALPGCLGVVLRKQDLGEVTVYRGWPCFETISDTIFPDTFEQITILKRLSSFWGHTQELPCTSAKPKKHTFVRAHAAG